MTTLPASIKSRLEQLPDGLVDHIERARKVGQELAVIHGLDSEKIDYALATHDLARALSNHELVSEASRLALELSPIEFNEPILIHGAIAALWLEIEEGVTDPEILEAVRWHTTGAVRLSNVAKVVYLADKLDPSKMHRYPFQAKLKELAQVNLDRAIIYFIDRQIELLINRGLLIHPNSVDFRNSLILGQSAS